MTVDQLSEVLAALPESFGGALVYFAGEGGAPLVRVVVLVPAEVNDVCSPRVELRSVLAYARPSQLCRCDDDDQGAGP